MKKLKYKLTLSKTAPWAVYFQILEQEGIEQKDDCFDCLFTASNEMEIFSRYAPELAQDNKSIFLRGVCAEYNNKISTLKFDTRSKARSYKNKVDVAMKEFIATLERDNEPKPVLKWEFKTTEMSNGKTVVSFCVLEQKNIEIKDGKYIASNGVEIIQTGYPDLSAYRKAVYIRGGVKIRDNEVGCLKFTNTKEATDYIDKMNRALGEFLDGVSK